MRSLSVALYSNVAFASSHMSDAHLSSYQTEDVHEARGELVVDDESEILVL